jgi:hypothetical protein
MIADMHGERDWRWLRGVLPIVLCLLAALAFVLWRTSR